MARLMARPIVGAEESRRWADLHAGVLAGDERTIEEVAGALLSRVCRVLRARRPWAPPDGIEDAALDAIADYLTHPDRFRPESSSLLTWVTVAADRNLLDAARRERARVRALDALPLVLLSPHEPAMPPPGIRAALLFALKTRVERKFALAWLRGRPSTTLAAIIEVSSLPEGERNGRIRLFKERIRLRLKRAAAQHRTQRA
jgi:DNA-directed RNA polymerase specialized sigma24 family protein